ncbi:hypothetical protein ERO13_D13G020600v2 [Gossypium hirsutum]|uniref:Transcription factor bHLH114 isoform X1 n=2 Tax=Gossypium TaxID=3633 RepID=A0A1U8HHI3_GOSHI|nr:transcription factor bHLH114 isoform X1 [Gossypium hirsutum]KAG4109977.1 hypothetical protein ERO13_D13G020600v2 [Gossypium hirsutum]TYH32908.1 hypothetical protein ES332_D13G022900v1 [Gossypium tomentosum]
MRKAAHLSPLSSQFYNIGNSEAQMPYLDVLMQMESKGNVNGDAFSMEPKIFYNDNQIRDGAFAIPYQSHFNSNFLQDYEYGSSNFDNNFQQSMSLSSKLAIPYLESESIQNGRKREIEFNNDPNTALDERNKNKRKKLLTSFEQSHRSSQERTEIKDFRLNMPVRRSQKLSDKITALQKLVSPYGKTDTASVLQEASLYIKLLQEQIQMLSSSYKSLRAIHPQEIGKKQQDLKSRGLCLVPISFTQRVAKEEQSSLEILNNM